MLRPIVHGALAGLALAVAIGLAFYKGCPIFDPILEHDTLCPF